MPSGRDVGLSVSSWHRQWPTVPATTKATSVQAELRAEAQVSLATGRCGFDQIFGALIPDWNGHNGSCQRNRRHYHSVTGEVGKRFIYTLHQDSSAGTGTVLTNNGSLKGHLRWIICAVASGYFICAVAASSSWETLGNGVRFKCRLSCA